MNWIKQIYQRFVGTNRIDDDILFKPMNSTDFLDYEIEFLVQNFSCNVYGQECQSFLGFPGYRDEFRWSNEEAKLLFGERYDELIQKGICKAKRKLILEIVKEKLSDDCIDELYVILVGQETKLNSK